MSLEIEPLGLPGVLLVKPTVFGDDRGFFLEAWNEREFQKATGIEAHFVQDNHSRSARGTVRGLHYQVHRPQGKLVRVTIGTIQDAVVDLRRNSPTFGHSVATELSADNGHQIWVPPGFAHGFAVLTESADVLYKTTAYYDVLAERSVLWNDPDLDIDWRLDGVEPLLSEKDRNAVKLSQAELYD